MVKAGHAALLLAASMALSMPAWATDEIVPRSRREEPREPAKDPAKDDPTKVSEPREQAPREQDPRKRADYRDELERKVRDARDLLRNARPSDRKAYKDLARNQEAALKAFDAYQAARKDASTKEAIYNRTPAGPDKNKALITKQEAEMQVNYLGDAYIIAGNRVTLTASEIKERAKNELAALRRLRDPKAVVVPIYSAPPMAIPSGGGTVLTMAASIQDIDARIGQQASFFKASPTGSTGTIKSGNTSSISLAMHRAMQELPGLNAGRAYDVAPALNESGPAAPGPAGPASQQTFTIPADAIAASLPSRAQPAQPPPAAPSPGQGAYAPLMPLPIPPNEQYVELMMRPGPDGSYSRLPLSPRPRSSDQYGVPEWAMPIAQSGREGEPALDVSALVAASRADNKAPRQQ